MLEASSSFTDPTNQISLVDLISFSIYQALITFLVLRNRLEDRCK
jgi:hypothetical protein